MRHYAGTGSCNAVGLVTTGPLFGQDGLRVTAGAYATVDSSLISQNLVHGTGAPVRTIRDPSPINNANLILGAGVRYAGARLTSYTGATGLVVDSRVQRSNVVDNAYGAINVQADGTTPNVGNPIPRTSGGGANGYGPLLIAENNWWGARNFGTLPVTPPPLISPTENPPLPENPVNGASAPDEIAGATTSNAVDFHPYRRRSAVRSDHGRLARPDRAAAGRRRRPDRGPQTHRPAPTAAPRSRSPPRALTTSASSACASPTVPRHSAASAPRRTRSRPRSRPTRRGTAPVRTRRW